MKYFLVQRVGVVVPNIHLRIGRASRCRVLPDDMVFHNTSPLSFDTGPYDYVSLWTSTLLLTALVLFYFVVFNEKRMRSV